MADLTNERLAEIERILGGRVRRTRAELVALIGTNAADNYLSFPDEEPTSVEVLAEVPLMLAEIRRNRATLTRAHVIDVVRAAALGATFLEIDAIAARVADTLCARR